MLAPALQVAALLLALWLLANLVVCLAWWRPLARIWREPVLRHPVLIIESDDWGAGPLVQAQALDEVAAVLRRHRDASGRAAVLTVAVVLAVPDAEAIRASGRYARIELDDPRLLPILDALRRGRRDGVLALQLHGHEHYWPATLMASSDPAVQDWLRGPVPATTEQLPSPLQSRWVDTGTLPSSPHAGAEVQAAVSAEVQAFERMLGEPPRIVVPPTFVWTREVEDAWAAQGIECIVTPGWRYLRRRADGLPDGDEGPLANGDRRGALVYLARADYFEPARGRDALYALRALDAPSPKQGLACWRIIATTSSVMQRRAGKASTNSTSCCAWRASATRACASCRRSSSAGCCVRATRPGWSPAWRDRLPALWQRLQRSGRPWKLMRLTGLAALVGLWLRPARGPGGDESPCPTFDGARG
jgi:hypothetical protein